MSSNRSSRLTSCPSISPVSLSASFRALDVISDNMSTCTQTGFGGQVRAGVSKGVHMWAGVSKCDHMWAGVSKCDHMWADVSKCVHTWAGVSKGDHMWAGVSKGVPMWAGVSKGDHMWAGMSKGDHMWVSKRDHRGADSHLTQHIHLLHTLVWGCPHPWVSLPTFLGHTRSHLVTHLAVRLPPLTVVTLDHTYSHLVTPGHTPSCSSPAPHHR